MDYNKFYPDEITNAAGDNYTSTFTISEEKAAIVYMDFPIPKGDIRETAQYAYNWDTVLEDTKNHKSHFLVSLFNGGPDQVKRFKIFTQVLCSLLRVTGSIGVYKGTQSLLIPKNDYLEEAEFMSDDHLPINLWIYFGLQAAENHNSGYTYGLKEFNKSELEIVNSRKSVTEIREFLFDISHYVLDQDIIFEDGQTCGGTEDEKIEITLSKGKFIEGKSLKLAY